MIVSAITTIGTGGFEKTDTTNQNGLLVLVLQLVRTYVNTLITIGMLRVSLNIVRHKHHSLEDFKVPFKDVVNYFLTGLILAAIVIGGIILLIVPGVIWAIKYGYAPMLVADKGLSPMDAIRASGKITNGHKMDLFLLGFVMFGICLLGLLALGVGLFIAVPVVSLTQYAIYDTLSSKLKHASASK